MKAEVYPGKDGWRFRVKANNGEILAVGESYVRRIDAEAALRLLFTNRAVDVTVRDHSAEVVDHYTIGKWRKEPSLDEVYTGPLEDTNFTNPATGEPWTEQPEFVVDIGIPPPEEDES